MPFIEIKQLAGADAATRASTIEAVTKAYCEATGKDIDRVNTVITEVDKSNWGRGGVPLG